VRGMRAFSEAQLLTGDVLTTADGKVMPDTVPHCTLQPLLWQHLKRQEKGAANGSLTSFPSLQGQWS